VVIKNAKMHFGSGITRSQIYTNNLKQNVSTKYRSQGKGV